MAEPVEPRVFSGAELATLALVSETFVRGDGMRRAQLAAGSIETSLDPAQVSQIRLVLRLFESRPANLALGSRPARFRDLDLAARERYLLRWGDSSLAMRRSAFAGLRKLLTFIAYADPGPDGHNPLLDAVGYHPTYEPVTADPTSIQPLRFEPGDGPIELDADVAIVGSGAGGGVIAAALAEAGRSVVVLEEGPFVSEADMPTDELTGHATMYLNHGLTSTWDASLVVLAGAGVGGATTINWMTSVRLADDIRAEWATEHGIEGVDGPGFEADMASIEAELDVSPAPNIPPKDAVLQRGALSMGYHVARIDTNAVGCGDCGTCVFGCRIGAKRSGLRAHLARASVAGARIVPDAEVRRVSIERGRATGVEAIIRFGDGSSRSLIVRAPQVVIAAGSLRTPAVLLRSGLRHRAIGRYLRLHPVSVIAGRFAEPIEMWRWASQAIRSEFVPEPGDGVQRYTIESAPGHPGVLALAFPWEGRDNHATLMERSRWFAPYVAVTRDAGQGRVSLTRADRVRIDYDLAPGGVATLRHALVRMARIVRAAGAQEILAPGTPPSWHGRGGFAGGGEERAFRDYEERLARFDFSPNRGLVGTAHQMGSARAGTDPREHPCDPWGRMRLGERGRDGVVGGLYVGDGSLFPTGIGVNPQITLMALSRRVARTVLAEGPAG
ncbi:MAG TPA: GMC family oxidoreductase [Candidatus Limnocylindrales bacterium]|nr:GMC family oxidoreductase [Candidatus Limnocylindrales bacterium]